MSVVQVHAISSANRCADEGEQSPPAILSGEMRSRRRAEIVYPAPNFLRLCSCTPCRLYAAVIPSSFW